MNRNQRCLGCMELFDSRYDVCPHCGYMVGTPVLEAIHMEPGTRFHQRYIIGKVLGFGGFGVTYLAWDERLEQKVAIKEYLPNEFSTRIPGQSTVTVFSGEKSEQFRDGMVKFVDEAKRLAKFQNEPGIVRIFDSFEENGTAYIIMEYLDGMTLKDYLKIKNKIPEDEAVGMLMPVMKSLQAVHAEGLIHRDIAPDNIFITKKGEFKLIDFGASRFATTSHSRSLTVIIKQGYSPEEQYRSSGDQGTYTDVYALAATLYTMITGTVSPDALERRSKYENQSKDMLKAPHKFSKISAAREIAILNAMNVRIEDRTQDIGTFLDELNANPPANRRYGKIKKIDFYRWPLWLKVLISSVATGLVIFGVLLATGVISFKSNYTDKIVIPEDVVQVPNVEGMSTTEAVSTVEGNELVAVAKGNITSEYIEAGKVLLQSPSGGTYLDINGQVYLTVSSGDGEIVGPIGGKSVVPYVVWDEKESALSKLEQAGLGTPDITEEYDENVEEGYVISQSIEAGEEVDEGTIIKLVISKGSKGFEMPDVVGMKGEEAQAKLQSLGLQVTISYGNNSSVEVGKVYEQSVAKGTEVKRGNNVVITVSSKESTIEVANVVGMESSEAKKKLEEQGFKVSVVENYSDSVSKGYIISQTPTAGNSKINGDTVIIYASKGSRKLTVSFLGNGGDVLGTSMTVEYGSQFGTLPTAKRTGYEFIGWFTNSSGGVQITAGTTVNFNTDITLYAHWSRNANVEASETTAKETRKETETESQTTQAQKYTVKFNANGGSVYTSSKEVTYGDTYGTLPTPTRSGYIFMGWYISVSGDTEVTSSTKVSIESNHTLYAVWSESAYKVSFNANGGTVSRESKNVTYGQSYGELPEPTRPGYTFTGWYTANSGGTKITSSSTVTITSSQTLYARWNINTYTVSFNGNGGSVSSSEKTVTYGQPYGDLPTAGRTGYTFMGWYTSSSGGNTITSTSTANITSNQTLYAQWNANTYTVSFNANGGWVSTSSKNVTYNSEYGSLPNPSRDYYTFNGWYTSSSGGSRITSTSTVGITSNQTLYAQWSLKDYGGWSGWSTTYPGDAWYRQIESQEVTVGYEYNYSKWSQYNSSTNGGWSGPSQGTWSGIYCGNYVERGWSSERLGIYGYSGSYPMYGRKGDTWWTEYTRDIKQTQYRYRDRVR